VVWAWVLGGLAVWLVVAVVLGVLLGRGIRLADRRETGPLTTADIPGLAAPAVAGAGAGPGVARVRRRAVPLPPVGMALSGLSVALMTVGYAVRLSDADGPVARALDMDAPFALPRMFVAALFGAAAVAAVAGAGRLPGRRGWWLGVALVGALIASVKAGGTVHAEGMQALRDAVGEAGAVAVSAALALAVVAGLAFLSRTERRDRRRVLGTLALYAVASVGLSAVSASVPAGLSATATYLEESGEALAAVSFLVAVLIGVAPRLVLPADWALRRAADAETLDVPAAARRPLSR
jgi:hypothetical protein